jgi:cytochrome c553
VSAIEPHDFEQLSILRRSRVVKNNLVSAFAIAALAAAGNAVADGDAAAGKTKSTVCIACHGQGGVSNQDIWPSLAGQRQAYLAKQLHAFYDGARKDPVMEPVAKLLSDSDISNLAAYFSSQPPSAPQPASAAAAPSPAPVRE